MSERHVTSRPEGEHLQSLASDRLTDSSEPSAVRVTVGPQLRLQGLKHWFIKQ